MSTVDPSIKALNVDYVHEPKTGGLLVFLAAISGCYFLFLTIKDVDAYSRLIAEDGIVEYASAVFWALAALMMLVATVKSSRKIDAAEFKPLPSVILLIFFVVCAGEEISWGQRLIGIETPDLLKAINVQDELNLHNIGSISVFSNAFFFLSVLFFFGLPYARSRSEMASHLIESFSIPFPNRYAVKTFKIALVVWIFAGVRFGTLGFHPFSVYAENYYNQLDDEIFECFAAYSFFAFSVMNSLSVVEVRRKL